MNTYMKLRDKVAAPLGKAKEDISTNQDILVGSSSLISPPNFTTTPPEDEGFVKRYNEHISITKSAIIFRCASFTRVACTDSINVEDCRVDAFSELQEPNNPYVMQAEKAGYRYNLRLAGLTNVAFYSKQAADEALVKFLHTIQEAKSLSGEAASNRTDPPLLSNS